MSNDNVSSFCIKFYIAIINHNHLSQYNMFPQPQQSQPQSNYQHIRSSSSAQQFQPPNVVDFNFQPPSMFRYMDNINNMVGKL